jgi:hypothetical protein
LVAPSAGLVRGDGRGRAALAICGAGNGAHALAAVASASFDGEILWLTSSDEKARRLRRGVLSGPGLRATGALRAVASRVVAVSSHPADVIPRADLVVLVLPAFSHRPVLERIAPHLKGSAWIAVMPARSGLEFDLLAMKDALRGDCRVIVGLQTLPWLCRVTEFGRSVDVKGVKARVVTATLPSAAAPAAAEELSRIIGTRAVAVPGFTNLTLGNTGQIIHPGAMYGLFGRWAGRVYRQDEVPAFYASMDEHTGDLLQALSQEIVTIARAVADAACGRLDLGGVRPVRAWLQEAYPDTITDGSTLAASFRTNAAYQGVVAPMRPLSSGGFVPDFAHRFLADDVPNGLAVSKAIAQIVGVATPTMDEVISWAQEKLGQQFLVDGKLDGRDAHALRTPQQHGITSVADLIAVYQ